MANQISVNTGSGAGAQQVIVDSNGNITVTVSRSVIGTVANVASANYANFAGTVLTNAQPNITSVGNLTSLNVTGTTTTGNLVVQGNLQVGNLVANSANYANFAGTAFAVAGANVSGTVANATYALNAGNANFANSATVASSANSVTLANVSGAGNIASINLDGNVANVLKGNGTFGPEGSTGNANYANFAGTAFSVSGSNVSGAVANATYAANAGFATSAESANTANSATVANSANSVTLANVSGAGNIASINIDGSGSNVLYGNGAFAPVSIGPVANANYANFAGNAYAVDGANVSGAVANATFALDAGNANIANIAYSVDAANVSGLGNIATINLDGNASNLLDGTGNFVAIPTVSANANYANFAGDVINSAQPNITSVGNLSALTVTGNITSNTISWSNSLSYNGSGTGDKILVQSDLPGGTGVRNLPMRAGNITNASASNTVAGGMLVQGGAAVSTDAGNAFIARGGIMVMFGGQATSANGAASSGGVQLSVGTANANNANATAGVLNLLSGSANAINGNAIMSGVTIGSGTAVATNGNASGGTFALVGANSRTITSGNAVGQTFQIVSGNAISQNGNATSGNIQFTTANAVANVTAGTATVGSIGFEIGTANGITANVKGNINIGTNNNANAVNIGAANTPVIVAGNLNANIVNANYFYGDGSNITNISATNANYANFAGDVVNATQSNITQVGNLVSLQVGNNAANITTTTFTPVGANITTLSGDIFVNNKRVSNDDADVLANGVSTQDAIINPYDTGNASGQSYVVNYLAQDLANTANIAIGSTDTFNMFNYDAGNAASPSERIISVYTADSDLATANPNTTLNIVMGAAGLFINRQMPNDLAAIAGSGLLSMMNYGELSDPTDATGIVMNRRRGNNSGGTSTRDPVEANDYLGNIVWRGAGTATGTINSGRASIGAKVDSSYGGPGNNMPIGMEMVVIDSSNTALTHSFYANGDVTFNNTVTATTFVGNIASSNVTGLGNIATINLDGNASNLLDGTGNFVAIPSVGTPNSIQNGNSIVEFTGPDGSLLISTDGINNGVQVSGRNLSLFGANTGGGDISKIELFNGALNWTLDNTQFSGGTPFGMSRYNNGFLEPLNFYTARGNAATPADVQVSDNAYSERVQVLYDGNTHGIFNGDVSVRSFSPSNTVAATYTIGSSDDQANSVFQVNFGSANFAGNITATNLGNIASINLDGNASNLLNGAGSFVAIPTNVANANYANFAGTVLTNAQPNISSVGTLTGLNVSSNSNIFIQTTASNITTESSLQNNLRVINTSNVAGGGTVQQQYYNTVTEQASFVGVGENGIQLSIANTNSGNSFPANLKTVWRVDSTGNLGHIIGGTGIVNAKGANLGTGNITVGNVNATGSLSYLRTYGSFTSNVSQTSNGANTTNYMTFNNDEGSNGVSIVSSSQLTVARTGRYNIQFSAQVSHDTNTTANIEIWLTKNGSAIANTCGRLTLAKDQPTIAAWNFLDNVTSANSYYQIAWASPDTNMEILAYDTANTISGVAIPSIIATIVPVGA